MEGDPDAVAEKRKSAYSSRLSRAKAYNSERGRLASPSGSRTMAVDSMANVAFSIPVQAEVDNLTAAMSNASVGVPAEPKSPQKSVKQFDATVIEFVKANESGVSAAHWEWNHTQELLAVVRCAPPCLPPSLSLSRSLARARVFAAHALCCARPHSRGGRTGFPQASHTGFRCLPGRSLVLLLLGVAPGVDSSSFL